MNALKRSREIKYGVSAEHRDLSVEGRAYIPTLHAHTMWHEIIPPSSWTSPLHSLESCASKSNRCIRTFHLLLTGTSHQSLHTFCLWKQVACTMHTHLSLPTWSLVTAFKIAVYHLKRSISCMSKHRKWLYIVGPITWGTTVLEESRAEELLWQLGLWPLKTAQSWKLLVGTDLEGRSGHRVLQGPEGDGNWPGRHEERSLYYQSSI